MNRLCFLAYIVLLACMAVSTVHAGDDFEWAPIDSSDWSVGEDPAAGIHNAVMLFERITVDDHKLSEGKCYYSIYARIRVLSPEGREHADIKVPYLHKKTKVEEIRGRTIHADGSRYVLEEAQIHEKEIIKAKGMKLKEKSFSLPAVTDDCIIEYYVREELPMPVGHWIIQKDMYLKEGEFVWRFFRGANIDWDIYDQYTDVLTPNYITYKMGKNVKVAQRPSREDPREVVFTVSDIPAFEKEPHSLPDDALKGQLLCYYGGKQTPEEFWDERAAGSRELVDEFLKKNKKLKEVVKSFGELASREEKIKTAYEWIQNNIQNTAYLEDEEDFKENKHVNDVIERGYGISWDINCTFIGMLEEMNISAKMIYCYDRDDNYFIKNAKFWQFDRNMVAVPVTASSYEFYNPGGKFLPCGSIYWYSEGTTGFIVGNVGKTFIPVSSSESGMNRINRYHGLRMSEDLGLLGETTEKHSGHSATSLRLRLWQASGEERDEYLRERFSEHFSGAEADSFLIEGLDTPNDLFKIKTWVRFENAGQKIGEDRLLLKPFDLFRTQDNPFSSESRECPIMFDYAKDIIDILRVDLPESWTVEALPADSIYSNPVGQCRIDFDYYPDQNALSVQRMFNLNKAQWKARSYEVVRELFQTQEAFEEMTVLLKRKP